PTDVQTIQAQTIGDSLRRAPSAPGSQPCPGRGMSRRRTPNQTSCAAPTRADIGSGLKGKTPEATISAMLAVGSKPGGPFKRVDKGTYTLADAPTAATTSAKPSKAGASKRAPTHTTATARSKAKTASSTHTRGAAKRTR